MDADKIFFVHQRPGKTWSLDIVMDRYSNRDHNVATDRAGPIILRRGERRTQRERSGSGINLLNKDVEKSNAIRNEGMQG